MRVDLHTHTTASDGALTPADLVRAAVSCGLDAIAITDHDTVAGIAAALRAAEGTTLIVVPGLELSAQHGARTVHLLAYGFDHAAPVLMARLEDLARAREERARAIVERLARLGAPIPWSEIAAEARGTIGRPHLARALIRAGHARSVSDAFDRFLSDGRPAYMPSSRLSVADAVDLVRDIGGAVALAHPLLPGKPLDVEHILPDLRRDGLTGLEVYHAEHDAAARERLRRLADENGLWWTGGSDFHGPSKPHAILGGAQVPLPTGGPIDRVLERACGHLAPR